MIIKAKCDNCGQESSGSIDYDGQDLCRKCEIKKELYDLKKERKEQREWIKDCWIKQLNDMSKEIIELEKELKILE